VKLGSVVTAAAVDDAAVVEVAEAAVPFCAIAAALNAVNELGAGSAGALIANTMPWPQCPVCSQ
jgi:hypothetical protein